MKIGLNLSEENGHRVVPSLPLPTHMQFPDKEKVLLTVSIVAEFWNEDRRKTWLLTYWMRWIVMFAHVSKMGQCYTYRCHMNSVYQWTRMRGCEDGRDREDSVLSTGRNNGDARVRLMG